MAAPSGPSWIQNILKIIYACHDLTEKALTRAPNQWSNTDWRLQKNIFKRDLLVPAFLTALWPRNGLLITCGRRNQTLKTVGAGRAMSFSERHPLLGVLWPSLDTKKKKKTQYINHRNVTAIRSSRSKQGHRSSQIKLIPRLRRTSRV